MLAKLAFGGAYTSYVKASLRPFLIAAAAVLLAVALATLWQAFRTAGQAQDQHNHGDNHGHDHSHGRFDVAWLLVIPMLAALLIAPPALSSYSAGRSGTALKAAAHSDLPPLPDTDPVRVSILDYASRAVFDHGRSLAGRNLRLSGFLVPDGEHGWYLTRMVIACCAADAQPIKVGITGAIPAGSRANDWIEVTGTYSTRIAHDTVNGEEIPFLDITDARAIPAPEQQYVS